MHIYGTAAEYNPFHRGHARHLAEARKQGATHLVAVMSGNFVQRGEPALADKFLRASQAVQCGADLVLELPVPYVLSPAEWFSRGAVSLLSSLGCLEGLTFGCECADLDLLRAASQWVGECSGSAELEALLRTGIPYPAALQTLAENALGPEVSQVFSHPNNLLALEYLRAAGEYAPGWSFLPVLRNVPHDGGKVEGDTASAGEIRRRFHAGEGFSQYLFPDMEKALRLAEEEGRTSSLQRLERCILSRLRAMSPQEAAGLPDVGQGLEYRICSAAKEADSLEDYFRRVKTRRYPMAKLRRAACCALLSMPKGMCRETPPYGRILAFNQRGAEILRRCRESSSLPLSVSLAKLERLSPEAARFAAMESRATGIWGLGCRAIQPEGRDYTRSVRLQRGGACQEREEASQ